MKRNVAVVGITGMLLLSTLLTTSVFGENIRNKPFLYNQKKFPIIEFFENNSPPEIPSKPEGPSYGELGERYSFSTITTDSDDDKIRYGWDFTGDKQIDKWSSFYESGVKVIESWTFWQSRIHNISVKAEDENGSQSDFSEVLAIIINTPPNTPIQPSGSTSGNVNINFTFYTVATDPDGDQVWYMWRFGGHSITSWIGPCNSSEWSNISVFWDYAGVFEVSVCCKDIHNSITDWCEPLTVKVTDLIDIRIPIINIGKVNAHIENEASFNLKNVSWNISAKRNRLIRDINISNNGTIEKLDGSDNSKISTDEKIILKMGLVRIKVEASIDEIVEKPYEKTVIRYGFIIGRVIIIPPLIFVKLIINYIINRFFQD